MSDILWTWFTNVEAIFSFLAMVFSGFSGWRLWRQNRQLRELARKTPSLDGLRERIEFYEKAPVSETPVALAVSLVSATHSIKGDVEAYLKASGKKMKVMELNMDGIKGRDGIEKFINRLRAMRRELETMMASEVHLFLQGPVMAGVLIGAVFDNWRPVILYQKSPAGVSPRLYDYWCPLVK
ncbi:MAG TPA: hypothetical protein ENJ37_00240 [Deltaproteobacteria bacterium]|nr:hypothetical protein [Deltaproteobacteria bacterium]